MQTLISHNYFLFEGLTCRVLLILVYKIIKCTHVVSVVREITKTQVK